jgi:hypothetical protein
MGFRAFGSENHVGSIICGVSQHRTVLGVVVRRAGCSLVFYSGVRSCCVTLSGTTSDVQNKQAGGQWHAGATATARVAVALGRGRCLRQARNNCKGQQPQLVAQLNTCCCTALSLCASMRCFMSLLWPSPALVDNGRVAGAVVIKTPCDSHHQPAVLPARWVAAHLVAHPLAPACHSTPLPA